jgi:hypothetical protein
MLRIMQKRCDDCQKITVVILPPIAIFNRPSLLGEIASAIICLRCHPEMSDHICESCLLPFELMRNRWGKAKPHAAGLCFKCYQRKRRRALQSPPPTYDLTHAR